MHLRNVRYLNDEESLHRLISNCPVLEDLMVNLREHCGMGKLTVVVLSLQSLSLSILYPNAGLGRIVIETPSLKYFKLVDHNIESHDCLVGNMPNLIEVDLDLDLKNIKSLNGSITSVKRLAICSETVYGEGFVFNQLEHLKVKQTKYKRQRKTRRERSCSLYLEECSSLKTTTITSREEELIKELALSSRASATCQLVFH